MVVKCLLLPLLIWPETITPWASSHVHATRDLDALTLSLSP